MAARPRRPEEDAAQSIIETTLGLPVELNDTGKTSSAWDFTIDPSGEPQALEVVQCLDRRSKRNGAAAQQHAGEGMRIEGLRRRWTVQVDDERPPAYRELAQELQGPLLAAEAADLSTVSASDWSAFHHPQLQQIAATLNRLRIQQAYAIDARDAADAGLVSLATGFGFATALGSDPGLTELEDFLDAPDMADVRKKLKSSGLSRRHALVWVQMTGAPSSWRLFGRDEEFVLPSRPPRLPEEVTDVWWLSGHRGWRWSPQGWSELRP